jgi:hypothetical protein
MIVPRSGKVTYAKADQEMEIPAMVRIRLSAGQGISDKGWPEVRDAISGVDGVEEVILSRSYYAHILVKLVTTRLRHTDAGMIADCRAICRAAKIAIVGEPEPAPER